MKAKKQKTTAVRDLWRVACPAQPSHSYEQYRDRADGPPPQKQCGGGCNAVVEKSIRQTHEQGLAFWADLDAREAERKATKKKRQTDKLQPKSNSNTNAAWENDMKTKPEEKTATAATKEAETERVTEELAGAGSRTPLALVQPPTGQGYVMFQPVKLDEERKALLKKMYGPQGCSDLELEFFFAFCERTGLDPMLKQAYLVARSARVKVTRNGQTFEEWVEKFEPLASEQGMAAKADGLPDFRGMLDGCVYKGDVFELDNVAQTVIHKTNPLTRGALIGAWAHVQREGRKVPISYFTFAEKAQYTKEGKLTKFWNQGGPSQLLKCCRAEQWRQGWPNIFGGQFVPEEMREEIDVTERAEATVGGERRDTTDVLAEKLKAETQAPEEAKPVSAKGSTVEVIATKPMSGEANMRALEDHAKKLEAKEVKADPATTEAIQKLENALGPDLAKAVANETMPEGTRPLEKDHAGEAMTKAAVKLAGGITHSEIDRAGPPPVGPLMVFGAYKNQPIASLKGADVLEQISFGEARISTLPPEKQAKVRACIDQLKVLQAEREKALEAPEPGSDLDVD